MRAWRGLFFVSFLIVVIHAQEQGAPELRLRDLTLISNTLPEPLRQKIVQGLHGIAIDPQAEELSERVRQYLRDAGYYNARVDNGKVSPAPVTPAGRFADVSFQVDPGALYTLGKIRFENGHVFPADEMRRQFHCDDGEHFNATEISRGLERLKDLYASKGYANFGTIPKPIIDESRHVVDLTMDIDEGRPIHFGMLLLEGLEPRAGAGKALMASWKENEGKLYNPQLLKEWLAANTSGWPKDAADQVYTEFKASADDPFVYNLLLHFQMPDP